MLVEDLAAFDSFNRIYLAAFYTFVAVFYTSRVLIVKNTIRQDVVFPGRNFCHTWWNHMVFRGFRVTIWMVCVCRWLFPSVDSYLGLIDAMQQPTIIGLGLILLTSGFVFALVVHFHLGQAWRSGIDPKGPTQLITKGLYGFSRNPAFVGVAIAQLGFFLALPSVFSLCCWWIGWMMLARQVAAEERHLAAIFGQEYQRYQHQVRRWV